MRLGSLKIPAVPRLGDETFRSPYPLPLPFFEIVPQVIFFEKEDFP